MGLRQHGPALLPLTSISEDRLSEAVEDARQLTAADVDALELANELGFWSRSGHGLVEDLSGAI
jgi:hypothetical protein